MPVGTFLGQALGWRVAFLSMTALTVVLLLWIVAAVPDYPGQQRGERPRMLQALGVPGVPPGALRHARLRTGPHGPVRLHRHLPGRPGHGRPGPTWSCSPSVSRRHAQHLGRGAQIQYRLRALTIASTLLVAAAAALLAVLSDGGALVYVAAVLWGLGWGGLPTLLQTAVGDAGGDQADAAQAMLVTLWNVAMAGGGVLGGVLLDATGSGSFPWTVLLLLVPVFAVVLAARGHRVPGPTAGNVMFTHR